MSPHLFRHSAWVLVAQILLGSGVAWASWSPQRRCAFNQRVLEGGLELCRLDRNLGSGEVGKLPSIRDLVPRLIAQGYLRSEPLCPGSRYFYGNTRGDPSPFERWFPSHYTVEIPMKEPLEYRFDRTGHPYCTAHGGLEGLTDRENSLEPFLPRHGLTILIALVGVAILFCAVAIVRVFRRRRSSRRGETVIPAPPASDPARTEEPSRGPA